MRHGGACRRGCHRRSHHRCRFQGARHSVPCPSHWPSTRARARTRLRARIRTQNTMEPERHCHQNHGGQTIVPRALRPDIVALTRFSSIFTPSRRDTDFGTDHAALARRRGNMVAQPDGAMHGVIGQTAAAPEGIMLMSVHISGHTPMHVSKRNGGARRLGGAIRAHEDALAHACTHARHAWRLRVRARTTGLGGSMASGPGSRSLYQIASAPSSGTNARVHVHLRTCAHACARAHACRAAGAGGARQPSGRSSVGGAEGVDDLQMRPWP